MRRKLKKSLGANSIVGTKSHQPGGETAHDQAKRTLQKGHTKERAKRGGGGGGGHLRTFELAVCSEAHGWGGVEWWTSRVAAGWEL